MGKKELAKIREALEKEESGKDCNAVQKVLLELGYYLAVPFNK